MIHSEKYASAVAFLLTAALTPAIIHLCFRWQILDPPGPLKIHKRPVPRLGGTAVVIAVSGALLVASPNSFARDKLFFLALLIIWGTGAVDDIWHLSAGSRFAAQIVAASVLRLSGWQLPANHVPGLSFVATVFWIMLFVNAFNFLDGSDGLAAGTACIITLGFGVTTGSKVVAPQIIAYAVAGSCAAFLVFNLRGKLHLGDGGSTSLGFLIASLGLSVPGESNQTFRPLLFVLVAAALPLLDCAFAVARRVRKGQSPLRGDRGHAYDLLRARGWSSRRVALACFLYTTSLTMIACLGSHLSMSQESLLSGASVGILATVMCSLGILQSENDLREDSTKETACAEIQRKFDSAD